ncbi:MAG: preprotein translocase subunit TatC [Syntrophus sp. (in: bacteria)]|nr:preprotein translocase subunit TatC [Syntrophus sp. (in: bacteria)]
MDREKLFRALGGVQRFLYKALAVVTLAAIISFVYAKSLILILLKTANIQVYYLSFPEAFLASVEIALYGGVFFSLPILIYLIWHEFRSVTPLKPIQGYAFVFFSILLFYLGGLFCYFVVLPSGISFLLGYGTGHIKAMISVQRFVVFSAAMIFAFGITFEVPIILLILNKIGLVKAKNLTKTRRYAILFITVASALITPTPDIYNMMLLAVPTYILFEIGILLMKISEKKSNKFTCNGQEEKDSAGAPTG